MSDPVLISSGNTFEREAISDYFLYNGYKDPVTGENVDWNYLEANLHLKKSIEGY